MRHIINEIQQAILNGESNYYGVKLPSPQKAGTYYQQSSYALLKAGQIYETHFLGVTPP